MSAWTSCYYCSRYRFSRCSSSIANNEVSSPTTRSIDSLLTQTPAALALIFGLGLIPVVASTMRLCEIAMSGNPVSDGMPWRMADSSWSVTSLPVFPPLD
jgi:hypothetical protein